MEGRIIIKRQSRNMTFFGTGVWLTALNEGRSVWIATASMRCCHLLCGWHLPTDGVWAISSFENDFTTGRLKGTTSATTPLNQQDVDACAFWMRRVGFVGRDAEANKIYQWKRSLFLNRFFYFFKCLPPLSSPLGNLAATSGHWLEPVPIRNLIKTQWLSTPEVLAYLHLCVWLKKEQAFLRVTFSHSCFSAFGWNVCEYVSDSNSGMQIHPDLFQIVSSTCWYKWNKCNTPKDDRPSFDMIIRLTILCGRLSALNCAWPIYALAFVRTISLSKLKLARQ